MRQIPPAPDTAATVAPADTALRTSPLSARLEDSGERELIARFSREGVERAVRAEYAPVEAPLALHPLALEKVAVPTAPGVTGTLRPYCFRTDDYVTASLLIGFFLLVWVVLRSRRHLQSELKQVFRPSLPRDDRFDDDEGLRGGAFIVLLTSLAMGVLHYDFLQEHGAAWLDDFSPYVILGAGTASTVLYFLLQLTLYAFVNHTLYDKRCAARWTEAYLSALLLTALVLLPLTLLVVYFDLTFTHQIGVFIVTVLLSRLLLLSRCRSIFFPSALGSLRLFLYFCTLEVVPAIMLWRSLSRTSDLLALFN